MEKMNQDIKKKWVAALRSGEYKQGRNSLKNHEGEYCCLGVLCDLAVREGLKVEEKFHPSNRQYSFDGDFGFLPLSVRQWAQLSESSPTLTSGEDKEKLDCLNDLYRLTFNEIADLIEEQL